MKGRKLLAGALAALALFTGFDHGMRLDQASLCQRTDQVVCPTKLWWFMPAAETDGELVALIGVHPLADVRPLLVGQGCEGAGATLLYREEEDEFPPCESIERM